MYRRFVNISVNRVDNKALRILCKVMERMVKGRLLDFFDQTGTLSTLQCGGRTKRTTIDHFLSLEATVRNAQANSEHIVATFFDMEKAYDLT